jgi:hypothetical protein
MKASKARRPRGFLARLMSCTLGDGGGQVAVAAVVTGLGITIAAAAGSKTKTGVDNASTTISQRANQGANGNVAGPK